MFPTRSLTPERARVLTASTATESFRTAFVLCVFYFKLGRSIIIKLLTDFEPSTAAGKLQLTNVGFDSCTFSNCCWRSENSAIELPQHQVLGMLLLYKNNIHKAAGFRTWLKAAAKSTSGTTRHHTIGRRPFCTLTDFVFVPINIATDCGGGGGGCGGYATGLTRLC